MVMAAAVHDFEREAARLAALERFGILDTAREREFDDVASLAAHVCGTPMAAITFIDRTRQWFKASIGLGLRETPREVAFCAWTVEAAQAFVVPDARDDVRFADNPYVSGAPHLRFYAGVPLLARDGSAVGALAVMDTVPRTLNVDQRRGLQVLADQVASLLDVRLALQQARDEHEALRSANDALRARVEHQATHDVLTGLVNRSEFDRRLRRAHEAAATRAQPSSLLVINLDRFRVVNDSGGHAAGDALLREVAGLLRNALHGGDTVARLGGDEFAVLLEDCPSARGLNAAEVLLERVSGFRFAWDAQRFTIGASIGHVAFHDGGCDPGELLACAHEACDVAKDLGRNRVHTHAPGEAVQARRRDELRWAREIERALDEDRFVLFAQPIYAVGDAAAAPLHYEVLLRLRDRDGTLVPPMAFIPAAERYRLMPRLDRWVIRRTLSALAGMPAVHGPGQATFAINLSGATLGDDALAGFIERELRDSGVPGARIGFEITETAAIANFAHAVRLIEAIRALGCRFALDDFGSGLSSFAYLRQLPVDYLKIDGSFVRLIATSAVDRAMVASINEIGHLMGLRTIAEFVEDDAILQQLRAVGVDFAQGYGLRRPAPLSQLLEELVDAAGVDAPEIVADAVGEDRGRGDAVARTMPAVGSG